LTARHAVEDCANVVVVKEGRRVSARVEALSPSFDIALIKVPHTLGLAAVFPRHANPAVSELMFAAGYDKLSSIVAHGGMLANATVIASSSGSEPGHLAIDSDVAHGASGAPVLDGRGLVEGVISRRTVSNRVLAVGAEEAKSFLAANGVRVVADDRPQMAGSASRAHRAASISVGVTCLQN
jgi:S1-C subfamily serine protease